LINFIEKIFLENFDKNESFTTKNARKKKNNKKDWIPKILGPAFSSEWRVTC